MPAPGAPHPYPYPYPPPQGGNGLAVAGMVCGIVGLVLCWIPVFGWMVAVVGIVLGAIGWSKANKGARNKGMAVAGVACGVAGILLGVTLFLLVMRSVDHARRDVIEDLERIHDERRQQMKEHEQMRERALERLEHDDTKWKDLHDKIDDNRYQYEYEYKAPDTE